MSIENLLLKVRVSVLWIFVAVSISAHSILSFMEVGMLKQVLSGEMVLGPGMMFFMSLFYWVPLVMAFLSVTLRDKTNRRVNIVLGIIFTVLNLIHFVEHLFAGASAHQSLIIGSTAVATALIVRYAWKWHQEET